MNLRKNRHSQDSTSHDFSLCWGLMLLVMRDLGMTREILIRQCKKLPDIWDYLERREKLK